MNITHLITPTHTPTPTAPPPASTITPSVMPTPKSNPYPLSRSLGIDTNLEENMPAISNLLSELVSLHKKYNKKLEFTHQNSKPGLLVPIPNVKNCTSYEKNERREEQIKSIFEFINSEEAPTESKQCMLLDA